MSVKDNTSPNDIRGHNDNDPRTMINIDNTHFTSCGNGRNNNKGLSYINAQKDPQYVNEFRPIIINHFRVRESEQPIRVDHISNEDDESRGDDCDVNLNNVNNFTGAENNANESSRGETKECNDEQADGARVANGIESDEPKRKTYAQILKSTDNEFSPTINNRLNIASSSLPQTVGQSIKDNISNALKSIHVDVNNYNNVVLPPITANTQDSVNNGGTNDEFKPGPSKPTNGGNIGPCKGDGSSQTQNEPAPTINVSVTQPEINFQPNLNVLNLNSQDDKQDLPTGQSESNKSSTADSGTTEPSKQTNITSPAITTADSTRNQQPASISNKSEANPVFNITYTNPTNGHTPNIPPITNQTTTKDMEDNIKEGSTGKAPSTIVNNFISNNADNSVKQTTDAIKDDVKGFGNSNEPSGYHGIGDLNVNIGGTNNSVHNNTNNGGNTIMNDHNSIIRPILPNINESNNSSKNGEDTSKTQGTRPIISETLTTNYVREQIPAQQIQKSKHKREMEKKVKTSTVEEVTEYEKCRICKKINEGPKAECKCHFFVIDTKAKGNFLDGKSTSFESKTLAREGNKTQRKQSKIVAGDVYPDLPEASSLLRIDLSSDSFSTEGSTSPMSSRARLSTKNQTAAQPELSEHVKTVRFNTPDSSVNETGPVKSENNSESSSGTNSVDSTVDALEYDDNLHDSHCSLTDDPVYNCTPLWLENQNDGKITEHVEEKSSSEVNSETPLGEMINSNLLKCDKTTYTTTFISPENSNEERSSAHEEAKRSEEPPTTAG